MDDLAEAVLAYENTVKNLASSEAGKLQLALLEVLIARDRVARALASDQPARAETLALINQLDQTLKTDADSMNAVAWESMADWRESFQPASTAWWWRLDDYQPIEKKFFSSRAALASVTWLSWISIAISLSYILEVVRRFLSTGADVPSIVLQGLLALLVGSTIIQLVAQAARATVQNGGSKTQAHHKTRILLLAALAFVTVAIAIGIEAFRSKAVAHFSNDGVFYKQQGQLTAAIQNYQRAISLKPDDSSAHYNLASVYEDVLEYDKAEAEFQVAMSCNDQYSLAYDRLARLHMLRRNDYVGALALLKVGLKKLDQMKEKNLLAQQDDLDIRFAMLRNRAWAYFGLGYFNEAANDLSAALEIRPRGAVAHCLLAQVLESEKNPRRDPKKAIEEYQKCVAYSPLRDDNEESWLGLAKERLSQRDAEVPAEKGRTK